MEAPPGFEPGVEVLQTSALPLGDGALWELAGRTLRIESARSGVGIGPHVAKCAERGEGPPRLINGAGNGIRTRDFDLGKVALYH